MVQTEVFRALSDPIRWGIVQEIAASGELAHSALRESLAIPKTNLSYHTKILTRAGLISTRRDGRNYFYALRRDVVRGLLDDVSALAPELRPAHSGGQAERKAQSVRRVPLCRFLS